MVYMAENKAMMAKAKDDSGEVQHVHHNDPTNF